MEWWQAIVLGLVEGVTEYLPVSSTGHLILAQRLLGIPDDLASRTFAICIQAGAIAAVIGVYLPRAKAILAGAERGLLGKLVLAFLPAAGLGVLAEDWIDVHLFGLWPVVAAWFAGGVALLFLARHLREDGRALEDLGARAALGIGLFQCLAMWPGTSRSLATIAGGLLLGLSMSAAIEFSLLLGVITLCAATAWKGLHHGGAMFGLYGGVVPVLGFLCAAVSAWLAVRWMLAFLRARGLAFFGIYRVVLAAAVAAWILAGSVPPARG